MTDLLSQGSGIFFSHSITGFCSSHETAKIEANSSTRLEPLDAKVSSSTHLTHANRRVRSPRSQPWNILCAALLWRFAPGASDNRSCRVSSGLQIGQAPFPSLSRQVQAQKRRVQDTVPRRESNQFFSHVVPDDQAVEAHVPCGEGCPGAVAFGATPASNSLAAISA